MPECPDCKARNATISRLCRLLAEADHTIGVLGQRCAELTFRLDKMDEAEFAEAKQMIREALQ